MLRYKRVGITAKPTVLRCEEIVRDVIRILRENGAEAYVDDEYLADVESAKGMPGLRGADIDALVVIGGDGTILRAVRELEGRSVPIIGINRGSVGFLAEINAEEIETLIPSLLRGEGSAEERSLLEVTVTRDGKEIFKADALNDAVISQGTISRLLYLSASVGGEEISGYHADGLIVSTPTGSTAYSLAAGGPVVHPRISAMILTPINPHSLGQRPVVIPGNETVSVQVMKKERENKDIAVGLTIDGQVYQELRSSDVVSARIDEHAVRFLRRKEDTFFHTLRTKLKWGE